MDGWMDGCLVCFSFVYIGSDDDAAVAADVYVLQRRTGENFF